MRRSSWMLISYIACVGIGACAGCGPANSAPQRNESTQTGSETLQPETAQPETTQTSQTAEPEAADTSERHMTTDTTSADELEPPIDDLDEGDPEDIEAARRLIAEIYGASPATQARPNQCLVEQMSMMDGRGSDGGFTRILYRRDGLPRELDWDADVLAGGGTEVFRYRRGAIASIEYVSAEDMPLYRGLIRFRSMRADDRVQTQLQVDGEDAGTMRTWLGEGGRIEARSVVNHAFLDDRYRECFYDEQGRITRIRRSLASEDGSSGTDELVVDRVAEYEDDRLVSYHGQRIWRLADDRFVVDGGGVETASDYDHTIYTGQCQSYFFRHCSVAWSGAAAVRRHVLPPIQFGRSIETP